MLTFLLLLDIHNLIIWIIFIWIAFIITLRIYATLLTTLLILDLSLADFICVLFNIWTILLIFINLTFFYLLWFIFILGFFKVNTQFLPDLFISPYFFFVLYREHFWFLIGLVIIIETNNVLTHFLKLLMNPLWTASICSREDFEDILLKKFVFVLSNKILQTIN